MPKIHLKFKFRKLKIKSKSDQYSGYNNKRDVRIRPENKCDFNLMSLKFL